MSLIAGEERESGLVLVVLRERMGVGVERFGGES